MSTDNINTIPGIIVYQRTDVIHVQSQRILTTLSSSFSGGGFNRVRHILNASVGENFCSETPQIDLHAIAARCGVTTPYVGLLTAVPMRKLRMVFTREEALRVGVLVTAGVGNASSAGISKPFLSSPGTINIIVLLDAKLTRAAMVNAIITVTEAKSAVLNELGVRTSGGDLATGTSTDTVTIAMTGLGTSMQYAGPATTIGWLTAKSVREALRESLMAT
ncbi:adenosylcobinamide amidohydrolase [Rhodoferax sp. GW822-FHT02A01]|uniref:adenosylcobinamide amidohydrolase n=1 Tax=Rhodoferax sp. GW822-FHT02A01 TaxID=3141537 RepID=UPI00315D8E08